MPKNIRAEAPKNTLKYWKLPIDGFYALEYHPLMSNELIGVEKSAGFGKRFLGLFNFEKYYDGDYHVKKGMFDDTMILVAVKIEEKNSKILNKEKGTIPSSIISSIDSYCGMSQIVIKQVYIDGKEIKACYGFGLRIAEKFKRKGLGQALILYAEAWACSHGAQYFYFSVNKGEH